MLTGVRLEMSRPFARPLPFGDMLLGKGKGFTHCCTGEELNDFKDIADQLGAGSATTGNIYVFSKFSNYGGGTIVIEAVRFNIIPEPVAIGLLGIAIPLIMMRRWRA